MKVYIAAPFELRPEAIAIMHTLESKGNRVTSRWLRQTDKNDHETAQGDLDDIAASHVLLLINPQDWADRGTGGRHFEVGYALAMGIDVVILGERSNLFHYLDKVRVISDVREL